MATSFKVLKKIESIYTGECIAQSPDGRFLGTANRSSVHVTDLFETPFKTLRTFKAPVITQVASDDEDIVLSLAIDSASGLVYFSTRGLHCYQFDLHTGDLKKSWKPHDSGVLKIQASSNGKFLVTGSADGTLKIWRSRDVAILHVLKGHSSVIRSVSISHDNKQIYSGSEDGNIRLWDVGKGTCLAVCKGGHTSAITGLSVSPCHQFLLSSSRDQVVNVWNLKEKNLFKTIPVFEPVEQILVVSLPDTGFGFWTAGQSGVLKLWNALNGSLFTSHKPGFLSKSGQALITGLFMYTRDNQTYIITSFSDHNIIVYTASEEWTVETYQQIIGYNQEITDAIFLSDNVVAVSTNSPELRLYNLSTGQAALIPAHDDMILCLHGINPGWLVSGSKDHSAILWKYSSDDANLATAITLVARLEGHMEPLGAVSIYCEGSNPIYVVTAGQDRTLKVWHPAQHNHWGTRFTVKAHDKDINSIDSNAKWVVSGSQDKTCKVWNSGNGSLVASLIGHKRAIWSCKFSSAGILTSSADKTIRLWQFGDFTCIRTFEGHSDSVLKVYPLAQSSEFLSAGADGLIKIWDINTADCTSTLDGHEDKIWALTANSSSQQLVSGGGDSTIVIWSNCTEEIKEESHRKRAEFILQEQEFSDYIFRKDYKNALALAFTKRQPYRLLSLFHEILVLKNAKTDCFFDPDVDILLKDLSIEDLSTLIVFVRDWNTNFRNYKICEVLLSLVFSFYPESTLSSIPCVSQILNSVHTYSERYFSRIDESLIQLKLVDLFLYESKN